MFAAIYFFMFKPQQKKKKEEESLRNSLKIGDEVVTIGGIIGRIINIREDNDSLIIESASEKIKITYY